jgi:hypothetical protein
MLDNKELEQLVRDGEAILKEEEKKKRRIHTLICWLASIAILAFLSIVIALYEMIHHLSH